MAKLKKKKGGGKIKAINFRSTGGPKLVQQEKTAQCVLSRNTMDTSSDFISLGCINWTMFTLLSGTMIYQADAILYKKTNYHQ